MPSLPLTVCYVIVHHQDNSLLRNAVLQHDLVGMTSVCLQNIEDKSRESCQTLPPYLLGFVMDTEDAV